MEDKLIFWAMNRRNKTAVLLTGFRYWEEVQGAFRCGIMMPDGTVANGIGRSLNVAEFEKRAGKSGFAVLGGDQVNAPKLLVLTVERQRGNWKGRDWYWAAVLLHPNLGRVYVPFESRVEAELCFRYVAKTGRMPEFEAQEAIGAVLLAGTGQEGGRVPANLREAARWLRMGLWWRRDLAGLPKAEFLTVWNAIAYLYPGLHPDDCGSAEGGWPRVLKVFAVEAWRRAGLGLLEDEQLYPLAAQRARLESHSIPVAWEGGV